MHNHDHHDHHLEMGRKFLFGIFLNLIFVFVELFYGLKVHSVSLIADAWHNLSDVAGLIISWFAFKMATKSPSKFYTYGYSKGTILASLANCVLLFLAVASMGYQAIDSLQNAKSPDGILIMGIASIGVLINAITALLFMKSNELNNRAAFLHMLADALVSMAVVIGGFFIVQGGSNWIDPLLGIAIGLVILVGTLKLLRSSLRLSLDGVPENIDIDLIVTEILKMSGIKGIDNVHLWAISTTRNAFTATLLIPVELDSKQTEELKNEVRKVLKSFKVQHVTLETHAS